MFKGMFGGKKVTSKSDVILALAGGLIGVWKAFDTIKEYKKDHENEESSK